MLLRKIAGILLMIATAAGILFSLIGLIEMWRYRPVVIKSVVESLALVDRSLNTTQDVLTIVGQVVQTTTKDVMDLQATTQALSLGMQDTKPMLDSLISLTSTDLPATVRATQTSLASAQNSALLIDNLLTTLTSIPLLPVDEYKPAVPLHTALAQVSTSLNTIMPSLVTINTSLADGKTNLGIVEVELDKISGTAQGIHVTLDSAQTVIDQYDAITIQLKTNVETAQLKVNTWINTVTWILSFVFVWSLIIQLGLCLQGLDMARGRRQAR